MLCSVALPSCTSSRHANTSFTPRGLSLGLHSGASLSKRQHLFSTISLSVRKWLVQQQTPFSGGRTSRFLGVISNTAPPSLSHTVKQHEVVRCMPRSSFSASAPVAHSSSPRRKESDSGV